MFVSVNHVTTDHIANNLLIFQEGNDIKIASR